MATPPLGGEFVICGLFAAVSLWTSFEMHSFILSNDGKMDKKIT